jgi:hypothetical protein
LHERIKNKLFLDRTRKDSNFKPPHICATLFQIEKCCSGIQRIAIPTGNDGLMVGAWTCLALDAPAGQPNAAARREWMELHTAEIADVRRFKPEYANRIEKTAAVQDQPETAA